MPTEEDVNVSQLLQLHLPQPMYTHPSESDCSQTKCSPEQELEVVVLPRLQLRVVRFLVPALGAVQTLDSDGERGIAEHPRGDETCTERLVLVLHHPRSQSAG